MDIAKHYMDIAKHYMDITKYYMEIAPHYTDTTQKLTRVEVSYPPHVESICAHRQI